MASPLLDAAALLTDLPMIHVTDATPGFLGEVYGKTIPASVHHREARVLARATAVYSSQMMAKRAAADFGRPLSRILSLPFGVNFKTLPPQTPKPSLGTRLNLLYVGGEWTRKGGTLMIESFLELRARGRNAHLTIVGHVPAMLKAELQARDDITLTGFLDKNRSHHLNRLSHMFAQAHLLVLPTRADCTPMVIA
ncbi:MAG: glycosyltransferase family 4 protein, partial [Pseudomonadota bacterium]